MNARSHPATAASGRTRATAPSFSSLPWRRVVALALCFAFVAATPWARSARAAVSPAQAATSDPARRFAERLKRSGRAEATLTRTAPDPLSGRSVTARGRIAIEPPDRLSLRFSPTGEQLTLRSDGGEWLQPGLGQMIRLGAGQAAAARRWWRVLLGEGGDGVEVRALGARRLLVLARDAEQAEPESAWVDLDAQGLPRVLRVDEGAGGLTLYGFGPWRFLAARGRSSFVQALPKGMEEVELP